MTLAETRVSSAVIRVSGFVSTTGVMVITEVSTSVMGVRTLPSRVDMVKTTLPLKSATGT